MDDFDKDELEAIHAFKGGSTQILALLIQQNRHHNDGCCPFMAMARIEQYNSILAGVRKELGR